MGAPTPPNLVAAIVNFTASLFTCPACTASHDISLSPILNLACACATPIPSLTPRSQPISAKAATPTSAPATTPTSSAPATTPTSAPATTPLSYPLLANTLKSPLSFSSSSPPPCAHSLDPTPDRGLFSSFPSLLSWRAGQYSPPIVFPPPSMKNATQCQYATMNQNSMNSTTPASCEEEKSKGSRRITSRSTMTVKILYQFSKHAAILGL